MKTLSFLSLFFILVVSACAQKPKPIDYGKDACSHCKMIITDPKFGAELVTTKGKIFIFDDLNCYWDFRAQQQIDEAQIAHSVVFLFNKPKAYVEASEACFLYADGIRSPMGSRIAAFSDQASCEKQNKKFKGQVMNWEAVRKTLQQ